jgi:hypothetical protein
MQLGDVGLTSTELEERAGKAMSVMEKFKQIFFSIAIAAEPLADFMARIVDSVLDMTQTFPGGGAGMLAARDRCWRCRYRHGGSTALAAPLLAAAVPAAAAAGAAGAAGFGAAGGTAAAGG